MLMEIFRRLIPVYRPYWFVDAKWICGLSFIFCLTITLLLATGIQLTDDNRGPRIAALAVGGLFVRSDKPADIEKARAEIRKQGGVIHPVPNMPEITITEKDLALSTTEVKLKVFGPLTTMIYHDGIEATASRYGQTPEQKEKFKKDATLLQVFTKTTHESLKNIVTVFAIVSTLLLLGVVYFSAGWGRLANPGLLLLYVSLPGSLVALLLTFPPKDDDGGPLAFLPSDVTANLGGPIGSVYYWVTILGVALLFAAFLGKIISHFVGKKHKKNLAADL